ncbi:MAG: HAMP domain-containing sensor histidine kinase [Chloroflexi bacterium]|nr:HAMP domain-containing sensor histidine kinase [Chloroflexota bacterium]MDA1271392.1 HAMP domain-containing sensor histidine kinase [Chloroflexota bacterium]
MGPGLPIRVNLFTACVALAGIVSMVFLGLDEEWSLTVLATTCFFILLIIVAGSFPLPVAPRATADVSTAVLFGVALLLEPGIAVFTVVVGKFISYITVRGLGERLKLPGYRYPFYKYPFNLGEAAITTGVTSYLFHTFGTTGEYLTPVIILSAAAMYLTNTALITAVVSLEMKVNPFLFWWVGTKENGAAELSLLCFGFLGAVVYQESPWTSAALIIPVAIIYVAFSRLATSNTQLEQAIDTLEALQGRIVSSAKLASIGAISLDLAHQIKNPLAIMLGRLEGLQDRLEEGTRERRHVDIAQEAGWRIQELTQTFTYIGRQEWVPLDIRELLDESLGMAGLRTSKRIETRWSYSDDLPHVQGNPVLIREALSNFFSNALEAVEEGGQVSIDATREGDFVAVRISDDGVGIPTDQLEHLFEPFHTTKSHGQGLGLFAAKHILEMHQGSVDIQSSNGSGATVTVRLPMASDEPVVNPIEEPMAAENIGTQPVQG